MKQHRKLLLWLVLNCLFLVGLKYGVDNPFKVDVRQAIFSTFDADPSRFCNTTLEISGFNWYEEFYFKKFINQNPNINSDQFKVDAETELIERVKNVVLKYSKNGGDGCGAKSGDLSKNILWVSEGNGHGCCSDHSQVFLALCALNNIKAREVHHHSHTFNEFYDEKNKKWIWVDTQFALMAKSQDSSAYLSFCELYASINVDEEIQWDFFGKSYHHLNQLNPTKSNAYFTKAEFSVLMMTMGNNIFKQDFYNQKLSLCPTEIRQMILLVLGINPSYAVYDPTGTFKSYYAKVKIFLFSGIFIYLFVNLFILFLIRRVRTIHKLST